jgi:hypothetical protein
MAVVKFDIVVDNKHNYKTWEVPGSQFGPKAIYHVSGIL